MENMGHFKIIPTGNIDCSPPFRFHFIHTFCIYTAQITKKKITVLFRLIAFVMNLKKCQCMPANDLKKRLKWLHCKTTWLNARRSALLSWRMKLRRLPSGSYFCCIMQHLTVIIMIVVKQSYTAVGKHYIRLSKWNVNEAFYFSFISHKNQQLKRRNNYNELSDTSTAIAYRKLSI